VNIQIMIFLMCHTALLEFVKRWQGGVRVYPVFCVNENSIIFTIPNL